MARTINCNPLARVKVYANGRTFKELVIDSATDLNAPEINNTWFYNCSFSKTEIRNSTIKNACIGHSRITNSSIRDIVCVSTAFENTSFDHTLIDAVFFDCCFYGVDFTHCDFTQSCRFIDCTFDTCSFPETAVIKPMETFSSSCFSICRDIPFIPTACPETGDFIGYKKGTAIHKGHLIAVIITLLIPKEAARSSGTGRKCRCQFARVLSIEGIGLTRDVVFDEASSMFNHDFIYRTGGTVYPDKWDDNRWDECSNGIHFFMSRQEAIDY